MRNAGIRLLIAARHHVSAVVERGIRGQINHRPPRSRLLANSAGHVAHRAGIVISSRKASVSHRRVSHRTQIGGSRVSPHSSRSQTSGRLIVDVVVLLHGGHSWHQVLELHVLLLIEWNAARLNELADHWNIVGNDIVGSCAARVRQSARIRVLNGRVRGRFCAGDAERWRRNTAGRNSRVVGHCARCVVWSSVGGSAMFWRQLVKREVLVVNLLNV